MPTPNKRDEKTAGGAVRRDVDSMAATPRRVSIPSLRLGPIEGGEPHVIPSVRAFVSDPASGHLALDIANVLNTRSDQRRLQSLTLFESEILPHGSRTWLRWLESVNPTRYGPNASED